MVPVPTQSGVFTALRSFILSVLPSGTAQVTGGIAGATLTVSAVTAGSLGVGDSVMGYLVQPGTFITSLGTGTGGVGTYAVSVSQTVAAGTPMWTGVPVTQAQVNRVPQPKQGDMVVMTEMFRRRLSTNVDTYNDVVFTGSIAATQMTVTAVTRGPIVPGATLSGTGIADNVRVMAYGTGTGGTGTYTVFPAQTVGSRTIAAGGERFLQATEFTIQLDVHGPNSGDFAQMITTLFRDPWGVQKFKELNLLVSPLHADEPKQIPFSNGEQQFENRWVITARLQVNETVEKPMQFADEAIVAIIDVEGAYPA